MKINIAQLFATILLKAGIALLANPRQKVVHQLALTAEEEALGAAVTALTPKDSTPTQ